MVVLGVIAVALAILFSLTAFAMQAVGRLPHPFRACAALAALLVLGVALLVD